MTESERVRTVKSMAPPSRITVVGRANAKGRSTGESTYDFTCDFPPALARQRK
jgi:hypothetical protein